MVVGGKWNGIVNQGAVFTAKPSIQTPPTPLPAAATPHTTQKGKCHFCGRDHLQPDCVKWAWYKKQIHIASTSDEKKVQADPPCFEKIIDGKTHKYCENVIMGHSLVVGPLLTTPTNIMESIIALKPLSLRQTLPHLTLSRPLPVMVLALSLSAVLL